MYAIDENIAKIKSLTRSEMMHAHYTLSSKLQISMACDIDIMNRSGYRLKYHTIHRREYII